MLFTNDGYSVTLDRFCGCLLGLAVGDALGAQVEFMARGSFPRVTDMRGGGPHRLLPGQWTDDTSMALCLAESLLEIDGFDARDQMERYVRWWRDGHLSSTGRCFDIGNTTRDALRRFERTGDPYAGSTDPHTAGNGSLMRLAPVALFYAADPGTAEEMAAASSRTTHGAAAAVDACRSLARMITSAVRGEPKDVILTHVAGSPAGRIRASGYVVDTLEAAVWAFREGETFEDAVLAAVNLGEDADTVGAVCGQLAGAHHGTAAIPERWLSRLAGADLIRDFAERLYRRGAATEGQRG